MNQAEKSYTPSGVRRAGDDYQDAVALDLLVSMLEHPDRYEWIRVEADDFGYGGQRFSSLQRRTA